MALVRVSHLAFATRADARMVKALMKQAAPVLEQKKTPSRTKMLQILEDALVDVVRARFEQQGADLSALDGKELHRRIVGHLAQVMEELFEQTVQVPGREQYSSRMEGVPDLSMPQEEYMQLFDRAGRRILSEMSRQP